MDLAHISSLLLSSVQDESPDPRKVIKALTITQVLLTAAAYETVLFPLASPLPLFLASLKSFVKF